MEAADTTNEPRRARRGAIQAGLLILLATLFAGAVPPGRAQPGSDEREPLFRVQRIEISVFGGYTLGDRYLELPPPLDPVRTNDTAADEILDFSGEPANIESPEKEIEAGWTAGGIATFYLTPNFGMQLFGAIGRADAVLTGLENLEPDAERKEIDRATLTIFQGGGSIVYHIGRERKMPVRPYVTLGFGGIINQFPDTDDPGALYFRYGGGITFPVSGRLRGLVSATSTLYSWDTDEVALDETVQNPSFALGLTWRYEVPEEDEIDEIEGDGRVAPAGR